MPEFTITRQIAAPVPPGSERTDALYKRCQERFGVAFLRKEE